MSKAAQENAPDGLEHGIFRLRHLARESLYTRQKREIEEIGLLRRTADDAEAEIAAAELRLRIAHQLNPVKIADFLSHYCPRRRGR